VTWILELIQNKPVDALMGVAVAVILAGFVPWAKVRPFLSTFLPFKKSEAMAVTDAHGAVHKLIDVINVCREHGDSGTAEALGDILPRVVVACCGETTKVPESGDVT